MTDFFSADEPLAFNLRNRNKYIIFPARVLMLGLKNEAYKTMSPTMVDLVV